MRTGFSSSEFVARWDDFLSEEPTQELPWRHGFENDQERRGNDLMRERALRAAEEQLVIRSAPTRRIVKPAVDECWEKDSTNPMGYPLEMAVGS